LPLYEYECQKCHKRTEKIEKVDGPHLRKCPHCAGKVERLVSRTSMQFKGTGWYVTDYAGKSGKSDSDSSGAGKPAAESKDGAAKDSSADSSAKEASAKESSKETKKSEEKKPAKKK
jgi:putative FmdB family regulatory protein